MSAVLTPRYWSFISYSSRDARIARRLHQLLETYAIPPALVGRPGRGEPVPRRLFPVFRDRDELPLSADLGSTLQDALRASRHLIVLCSPQAAASRWVNEEVRFFKELGRADRILAIIVAGEPNAGDWPGVPSGQECFPPALRFAIDAQGNLTDERVEPLAGDLRPGKDGWNAVLLKCVAGITGLGFDDLRKRDQVRRRQQARRLGVAAVVLVAVLTALAGWGIYQGNQARQASQVAGAAQAQAKTDRSKRETQQYLEDMREVALLWKQSEPARAAQIVSRHESIGGDKLEWNYWRNVIDSTARTIHRPDTVWTGLALDDVGHMLAGVTSTGRLVVFDLRTGKVAYELEGDVREVRYTSNFFVTLPLAPEGPLQVLVSDTGHSRHESKCRFATGLAVFSKGDFISSAPQAALGNIAGEILLFDLVPHPRNRIAAELTRFLGRSPTGDRPLDAQHGAVTALSFGKEGTLLAVGYEDGAAQVWQIESNRDIISRIPPDDTGPVTSIVFSPSGNLIAMQTRGSRERGGAIGSALSVWQAATGTVLWTAKVHAQNAVPPAGDDTTGLQNEGELSVAFSPDETKLYSTGDRAVLVWDIARGDRQPDLTGHTGRVLAAAVSADGQVIAGAGTDGTIRLWKPNSSPGAAVVCDTYTYAYSVAISDDGRRIAAVCEEGERMQSPDGMLLSDKRVYVWSNPEGKELEYTPGIAPGIRALRFDPETGRFHFISTYKVSPDDNDKRKDVQIVVGLSDPQKRYVLSTVQGQLGGLEMRYSDSDAPPKVLTDQAVSVVALSPDGDHILAGLGDGRVIVWSHNGEQQREFQAHQGEVNAALWSASAKSFATGGMDRSIGLWNAESGELVMRLDGHRCEVSGLAFDPTGKRLVSSSGMARVASNEAGEVLVWDVETGQQCLSLTLNAPYRFSDVAVHADGTIYAAANSAAASPGEQQSRIVRWDTRLRGM